MIEFHEKGDFSKLNSFFERIKEPFNLGLLNKYGEIGVERLMYYTPKDTGLASLNWYYEIERPNKNTITLSFYNSDIENNLSVVILLQYGHATKNGGWVEGIDFINPALKPVFEQLAEEAWREVAK